MQVTIVAYLPRHAPGLAAMFNASDSSWPWGFGGGITYTPERAAEFMEESNGLLDLIALGNGEVVGFCQVCEDRRQPATCFIRLLNVRPDWQGRGVGRQLLVRTISLVSGLGCSRLDLMTWPANLKAMPLYKKTGFYWVPGTSVNMRNYLPLILNQSWAQEFFRRHFWYRWLVRDLQVAPDDERWQGMKAYVYRWPIPGEELEVVIDAEAGGITAISSPLFSVACRVDAQRPAPGSRVVVTWTARAAQASDIPLVAQGDTGLVLDFTAQVPSGTGVQTAVEVAGDATEVEADRPAAALHSQLVVDGQTIALCTGLRVTVPARLEAHPARRLRPQVPTPVWLGLVNRRDAPLTGRLTLSCTGARLAAPAPVLDVQLGPEERLGTELVLTPHEVGVVQVQARLEHPGDGCILWSDQVSLAASAPGGTVAYINARTAGLESPALRVEVELTGQWAQVSDAVSGKLLASLACDRLGPPYYPSEFTSRRAGARTAVEGEQAVLYLEVPSDSYPGLILRRRLALRGAYLELGTELVNASDHTYQLSLRRSVMPYTPRRLAFPLRAGLICQEVESPAMPAWDDDFPEDDWAETWVAAEDHQGVLGLIWDSEAEVDPTGFIHTEPVTALPGEKTTASLLTVVYLPGDWPAVRGFYLQRRGEDIRSPHRPAPVRRVYLRDDLDQPSPPVLALVEAPGERILEIQNLRYQPLDAQGSLAVGPGWELIPPRFQIHAARYGQPQQAKVHLTPPPRAGATWLEANLELPAHSESHRQVLIRPQAPGEVSVAQTGGIFTVDNGRLRLEVAPACVGALVSLRAGDLEILRASYPQPGRYEFYKPWHGGVHPVLVSPDQGGDEHEDYPGPLYHTLDPGRPCTITTTCRWQGVEVGGPVDHRDLRGLDWQCRYLTLPASNLVAILYRVNNPTNAPFALEEMGIMAFWRMEQATAVMPDGRQRRVGQQRSAIAGTGWLRLDHTAGSVVLAGTGSYYLADNPGSGLSLSWTDRKVLPPKSSLELVWYLAVADHADQADQAGAYTALATLERLF